MDAFIATLKKIAYWILKLPYVLAVNSYYRTRRLYKKVKYALIRAKRRMGRQCKKVKYALIRAKRRIGSLCQRVKYALIRMKHRVGRLCRDLAEAMRYGGYGAFKSKIAEKFRAYRIRRREEKEKSWARLPHEAFVKETDPDFINRIAGALEKLPVSNGGRYFVRHPQKIGIVADEFLFDSIHAAADFVFLTPENWEPLVNGLDMLLVVSAWKGIGEEWRGAAQEGTEKREALYRIIGRCKERGIPTVFYSKEDPPNYKHFLGLAQKCDYIFTTCLEVMANYRQDCGNDNVGVLKFGINPLFHNPVGMRTDGKRDGVLFSGSWMNKYPERQADMRMLLGGVMASGKELKIIDRNFDRQPAINYRYPPEYWKYLSPAVAHDVLQQVHKLYDWALNINTVKASRTMFANRGYELQAGGNLLISNYSTGVNEQLPTVFICQDDQEVSALLSGLTQEEIYERQIAGIREMMTGNTCYDRVGLILDTLGLPRAESCRKALVVVKEETAHIQEMFARQRYPYKELITEGELTQERFKAADIISFFHDRMEYEMFYLEDMVNAFKYTDCDYITKDAYMSGDELHAGIEHNYVSIMGNKYRTVFWREPFGLEQLLRLDGSAEIANGYSADHFNYNATVWSGVERTTSAGKASVVIPVGAGEGLLAYAKAFGSIRRSSIFEGVDVVFAVLDGAAQQDADYAGYVSRRYGNVRVVRACQVDEVIAGLGSTYFTVLSASNEAIHDGLRLLLEKAEACDADMVFGDAMVCENGVQKAREAAAALNRAQVLGDTRTQSDVEQTDNSLLDHNACLIRTALAGEVARASDVRACLAKAKTVLAIEQTVCAEYV